MTTKVLIAGFKHETNSFSKLRTGLEAYRSRALHYGDDIAATYRGTRTEVAAFLDACDRHGWLPRLAVVADAVPAGPVTREAFEEIVGALLSFIERDGRPDAVLLNLHGAMVAEHAPDGEGLLLSRLRQAVGSSVPIGATLDLHANVSDQMAEMCDVMVSYRTYPHVDLYETGAACAELIARTLAGEIHPTVTVARGAMLEAVDGGRTTAPGPMRDVLAKSDAYCADPRIHSISINAGFSMADISDAGPTAVVVGEGRDAHFDSIAAALVGDMWESRAQRSIELVSVPAALADAVAVGRVGAPAILADFADNPGGGGYGDSTALLGGMIDAGLDKAAFSSLWDPQAVAACQAAGEGAELKLRLGGHTDPDLAPPIEARGVVQGLFDGGFRLTGPMATGAVVDLGRIAVFRVGGLEVVLASKRAQNFDLGYFRNFGIEPTERAILGVKSSQHFRAAYGPIAGRMIVVDQGGGLTSHDLNAFPFRHVRRPIWPLDEP